MASNVSKAATAGWATACFGDFCGGSSFANTGSMAPAAVLMNSSCLPQHPSHNTSTTADLKLATRATAPTCTPRGVLFVVNAMCCAPRMAALREPPLVSMHNEVIRRSAFALVASQDGRFTVFGWSPKRQMVRAHRIEAFLL